MLTALAPNSPASTRGGCSWGSPRRRRSRQCQSDRLLVPRAKRGLADVALRSAAKLSTAHRSVPFTAWLLIMFGWRGMFWTTAGPQFEFSSGCSTRLPQPEPGQALDPRRASVHPRGRRRTGDSGGRAARAGKPGVPAGAAEDLGSRGRVRRVRLSLALLLTWPPGICSRRFGSTSSRPGSYAFIAWMSARHRPDRRRVAGRLLDPSAGSMRTGSAKRC